MKTQEEMMTREEIQEGISLREKLIQGTREDIRYLEKQLEELNVKPYIRGGDTLYYSNYCGEIDEYQAYGDLFTFGVIEAAGLPTGNISKSKAYITETEKMVQLVRRLRLFLEMEGYRDWEPDWEDEDEKKWRIRYDHEDKRWYVHYDRLIHHQGTVYFPSPELAEKAIKEVVKPLEKEWAK